jgi:hypothetical protein
MVTLFANLGSHHGLTTVIELEIRICVFYRMTVYFFLEVWQEASLESTITATRTARTTARTTIR